MAKLMKGHPLKKALKKLTFPMIAEPKEDEVRCRVLVTPTYRDGVLEVFEFWRVQYLSYAEKPLHNLGRFDSYFAELAYKTGVYEFDTGFHVVDFDTTYRWVRSSKGLKHDLLEIDDSVPRFILFDLPTSLLPFSSRLHHRAAVAAIGREVGLKIDAPYMKLVQDLDELMAMYKHWRSVGLEGAMAKTPHHTYERARTWDWLKVKPCEDADGVIFDLVEAVSDTDDPAKGLYKGKKLGRIGSVGVRMEDGSTAYAHGIDHGLGIAMYGNPDWFAGQWVEIEYMERDRQGGYRHPVFKRLREAKA